MDFRGKLILAPLAGVTDTTFRRLCRENGADIVVTEMVSAKGLLCDPVRSGKYLAYEEAERPVGAQLFGSDPGEIAEAAAEVARRGFDFVDINMGCPVRKVTGGGSGAAILSNPRLAGKIARAAVRAAGIPVTAKIRSGFGTEKESYLAVAEELFAARVAAVTLHPRHRGQMFAGSADWTHIAALKRAFPGETIIGNGDVRASGGRRPDARGNGVRQRDGRAGRHGKPVDLRDPYAGDRPPRRPRRSAPARAVPHPRSATRPDPAARRGDVPAPSGSTGSRRCASTSPGTAGGSRAPPPSARSCRRSPTRTPSGRSSGASFERPPPADPGIGQHRDPRLRRRGKAGVHQSRRRRDPAGLLPGARRETFPDAVPGKPGGGPDRPEGDRGEHPGHGLRRGVEAGGRRADGSSAAGPLPSR